MWGETPLHLAAEKAPAAAVALLLQSGAAHDVAQAELLVPLHYIHLLEPS